MSREKAVTYFIAIDKNTQKLFNDKVDFLLEDLYRQKDKRPFKIIIIDQNGISDDAVNEIVEKYILETMKNRGIGYAIPPANQLEGFCENTKFFIRNLIGIINKECTTKDNNDAESVLLRIIAPNESSFLVSFPKELISESKHSQLLGLGRDYLKAHLYYADVFVYIVPRFYIFLSNTNAFDDERLNKLDLYMIAID